MRVFEIIHTDDYSRYGYIYPIKERSEALEKFKIFKLKVENQYDLKIKIVRSDRGGNTLWASSRTLCKVPTRHNMTIVTPICATIGIETCYNET